MPAEFTVGYRSSFGEPLAPMTEEEAREALPKLRKKWADAILLTRDIPTEPWRRAHKES